MTTDSSPQPRPFRMAVLGLGAVGQRMLEQSASHPLFEVVCGFDPSAETCAQVAQAHPQLALHDSAESALAHPELDVVYVAAPPLHHSALVRLCMARQLPVLCEKPLGVDVADSQALTHEMQATGLGQAVNFVFASAPAVGALQACLAAPNFDLQHVFIRLHFHQWPRPFQAHAQWLNTAAQGGFTREVTSHFIYLLERALGPVETQHVRLKRASAKDAESQLSAHLIAQGVPVTLLSTTGGPTEEIVEARFIGAQQELVLRNWYTLWAVDAQHPEGQALVNSADPRRETYQAQLHQLAALLQGQPHSLPDFAQALRVQTTIEGLLAA